MGQRLNYAAGAPELFRGLSDIAARLRKGSLGNALLDLVNIRASQINGCAFCLDMHVKEAKIHGESLLKVFHIQVWHESPLFSARERAALRWTEYVTNISEDGVPEDVYLEAREHFSESELSELTFAIGVINTWNRLAISFHVEPGSADKAFGLEKAGL